MCAYVQRVAPAIIARTHYDGDEDSFASTPSAMERREGSSADGRPDLNYLRRQDINSTKVSKLDLHFIRWSFSTPSSRKSRLIFSNLRRWVIACQAAQALLFEVLVEQATAAPPLGVNTDEVVATVLLPSLMLVESYSSKEPFWAMVTHWLSAPNVSIGLAVVSGEGRMECTLTTYLFGVIREQAGATKLLSCGTWDWHWVVQQYC